MAVRQGSSPSQYNMESVKCELFVQASQSRNGVLTWERQTNSSVCFCLLSTERCVTYPSGVPGTFISCGNIFPFFLTWKHWLYEITLTGKGVKRLTISAFLAGARDGTHRKQQWTQRTNSSMSDLGYFASPNVQNLNFHDKLYSAYSWSFLNMVARSNLYVKQTITCSVSSTSHSGSRKFSIFFLVSEQNSVEIYWTKVRRGLKGKTPENPGLNSNHQAIQVGNVVNCSTIVWLWMPDRALYTKPPWRRGANKVLLQSLNVSNHLKPIWFDIQPTVKYFLLYNSWDTV